MTTVNLLGNFFKLGFMQCKVDNKNSKIVNKNYFPAQKSSTTTLSRNGVNKAPNALCAG